MDEDEVTGNNGHPVAFGLLAAVSVTTVRYYAHEYLIRTQGIVPSVRFFRQADRRLAVALASFAIIVVFAGLASYASMGLAYTLIGIALANAFLLIVPPGLSMVSYARQEMAHRRATRGSAASRVYQTVQDRFPRIFP